MFERVDCNAIHLHGFLKEIRCEKCDFKKNIGYQNQDIDENCPKCNSKLRPNIVFFNEPAPAYMINAYQLHDCEMLVVIGTSGLVISTDSFLNSSIKISILNNLEPSIYIDDTLYTKAIYKKATEAIDEIALDIRSFLS